MRCLHVIYFCLFNRKLQLNLTDCSDRIVAIHRLGCKCQPGVALQVHPSYFFYYQWEPICSGTPKKPHRFQCDNVTRLHTAVQQPAAPKNWWVWAGLEVGWHWAGLVERLLRGCQGALGLLSEPRVHLRSAAKGKTQPFWGWGRFCGSEWSRKYSTLQAAVCLKG